MAAPRPPWHSDQQLALALVHDAHLLCAPEPLREAEVEQIRKMLHIAELLLGENATDEERAEVYEILHPATLHLYLR